MASVAGKERVEERRNIAARIKLLMFIAFLLLLALVVLWQMRSSSRIADVLLVSGALAEMIVAGNHMAGGSNDEICRNSHTNTFVRDPGVRNPVCGFVCGRSIEVPELSTWIRLADDRQASRGKQSEAR